MTRSELIDLLAERTETPIHIAEKIIHIVFDGMSDALISGDRVEVRGFGSFVVREYAGRSGRNPKTGEPIPFKPKKSPFFKVGKDLKGRVKSC